MVYFFVRNKVAKKIDGLDKMIYNYMPVTVATHGSMLTL